MSDGRWATVKGLQAGAAARVVFPSPGVVRIESANLFRSPDSRPCQRFLQAAFRQPAITAAALRMAPTPCVDLVLDVSETPRGGVLELLADALERGSSESFKDMPIAPARTARDRRGLVRYRRYAGRITGWFAEREHSGSLRLNNPALYRKRALCQAIERELRGVLGVNRYGADARTCRVDIEYDPRQIRAAQLVEILDEAMAAVEPVAQLDKVDHELTICSASLPLAAMAQFALPALLPVSAALILYTALPSFKGAWNVVTTQRRLGVDVLDSLVTLACLGAGQIFAGAILAWCLGLGRFLMRGAEDSSKKLLLGAFGKQPRFVWRLIDGREIQTPLGRLKKGDVVVVRAAEAAPVDGVIAEGMAMIDQHALTGDPTPAEKGVGDYVFASTVIVAGTINLSVEKSGAETATAKMAEILNAAAGYRLAAQHKGEQWADKAVLPTLAVGAVALGVVGPQGAAAVLNSDISAGVRMSVPLAMLSTLAACAQRGVLVKDSRALDLLCEVDTVLFDKAGLLTRERPEVGALWGANAHAPLEMLRYAAAAERRFHHPIALAIRQKAEEEGLNLPDAGAAQYRVGYGVAVGVEGHTILVGSRRFLDLEGVRLTAEVEEALDQADREGHAMVMVAVDGEFGGALELRASVRPETPQIIKALRQRGVNHIVLLSGDPEAETRELAAELGMDRYFARASSIEKAGYVDELQREGRKVCFVGDGVDDALAMKKADVSISLRGAASLDVDAAHVVLLAPDLGKLCELSDIARELQRNVRLSLGLVLAPNLLCIVGVFTFGFGIAASVVTNNVAALGALGNAVRPMRKVAAQEAERRHLAGLRLRDSGLPESIQGAVEVDDDEDDRAGADAECAVA